MTPRTQQTADLVAANPGLTRADIEFAFGCSASTAENHLWRAKRAGLVRVDAMGMHARWWPVERLQCPHELVGVRSVFEART